MLRGSSMVNVSFLCTFVGTVACFSGGITGLALREVGGCLWTSWGADVIGNCNLIRRVMFLSLRVAVSLDMVVLWGRITLHRKLMRLKVGSCLGDHPFLVIELLCLVW